MAKKIKDKVLSSEEIRLKAVNSAINEIRRMIDYGIMPLNPTRSFSLNERVLWGSHKEVYVREVHENGLYYTVESLRYDKEGNLNGDSTWTAMTWLDLNKYKGKRDTSFAIEERFYIRQLNSGIDSLIHMVYSPWGGVDFNVEYQREHVWELKDKVALIDSIFNNIEIGKFVFVQRNESTPGRYYEIIDGKQRLTALCEFYEDRYKYKGKFFSELSGSDRHRFFNHSITYGYLENPSLEAIYSTFIKMNTCGKPMDSKHLDKVKDLLKQIKK